MTSPPLTFTITPGQGLNLLPFGKTPQDCINLLGQPHNDQLMEEPIFQTKHLVLHYRTHKLDLFFDLNNNSFLTSFECSNKAATINGTAVFDLDEKALTAFMKSIGFTLSETEQTTWGEKRLGFDEAGIDAFFEHKKLNLLQCALP